MAGRAVRIRKVCICGFGLIGGSIALDLLRRNGRLEVVAHDRPKVLERIKRARRFRVTTESKLNAAVAGADIVILAASQARQPLSAKTSGRYKEPDGLPDNRYRLGQGPDCRPRFQT